MGPRSGAHGPKTNVFECFYLLRTVSWETVSGASRKKGSNGLRSVVFVPSRCSEHGALFLRAGFCFFVISRRYLQPGFLSRRGR
jgi:hypothetical protein